MDIGKLRSIASLNKSNTTSPGKAKSKYEDLLVPDEQDRPMEQESTECQPSAPRLESRN